ncbi:MAG: hypothetical protein ACKO1J_07640 [Tagaea sp.]
MLKYLRYPDSFYSARKFGLHPLTYRAGYVFFGAWLLGHIGLAVGLLDGAIRDSLVRLGSLSIGFLDGSRGSELEQFDATYLQQQFAMLGLFVFAATFTSIGFTALGLSLPSNPEKLAADARLIRDKKYLSPMVFFGLLIPLILGVPMVFLDDLLTKEWSGAFRSRDWDGRAFLYGVSLSGIIFFWLLLIEFAKFFAAGLLRKSDDPT